MLLDLSRIAKVQENPFPPTLDYLFYRRGLTTFCVDDAQDSGRPATFLPRPRHRPCFPHRHHERRKVASTRLRHMED